VAVGEDAAALAAAVVVILREPGAATARAERARRHVRQRFSWATAVRRLEQVAAEAGRA
jgi:glycosyltransferase involved in cell wall biosynthesis